MATTAGWMLSLMLAPLAQAAELDWLAGDWCNGGSEEHWLAERGGLLLGLNRSGGDKVFFEFLRIDFVDGKARYHAQPGGRPAVLFAEFERSPQAIGFANPQHDFPRRIRYWREGERLHAAVDDGDGGGVQRYQWSRCPAAARP